MNRSETIGKLAAALAKAQGEMDNADKDSANPHFKSKYADLASVRAAIRGPFSSNGLAYVQLPRFNGEYVEVETVLMHAESGEFIGDTMSIPVVQKTAHGVGSAVTYGRRFSLMAIAGIAPDEDDDGNAASARAPTQTQRQPVSRAQYVPAERFPDPIDEIPHTEPKEAASGPRKPDANTDDNAPVAPASVPAGSSPSRVDAIPTVKPSDPKADSLARKAAADAQRKQNYSTEVRGNLLANLAKIKPDARDARSESKSWLSMTRAAKINLTDEDYTHVITAGYAKNADISLAEKAAEKARLHQQNETKAAYLEGFDDPDAREAAE